MIILGNLFCLVLIYLIFRLFLWLIKDTQHLIQTNSMFEAVMFCLSFILISYSVGFIARYWIPTLFLLIIAVTFGTALLPGIIPFYSLRLWTCKKLNLRQVFFHLVALICTYFLFLLILNFEDKVNVDGYDYLLVNPLAKQIAQLAITLFSISQLGRFIYVLLFRRNKE